MRICHVGTGFTSIPPQISAATEEVVYYLSKELISLGCDISVLDVLDRNRQLSGLPIIEIPYFSFIKTTASNSAGLIAKRLSFSLFSTFWLRRFQDNFDFIHFHNQFPASLFQLSAGARQKSKLIYTVHNPVWGLPDAEMPKNAQRKFILELEVMKKARKVIAVSETLKNGLIKWAGLKPSSIAVIPNGVDAQFFHPRKISQNFRRMLAQDNEKIVLCVGRISRFKGQKLLVDAVPSIVGEKPGVKFVFVGPTDDSHYVKEIRNTIETRSLAKYCVFTGTVPLNLLPEYFGAADVFALPSITEGLALTLLQAMSCGKAIVASAIPQNKEVAKEGNEILFANLSIDEFASAIVQLLADDQKIRCLGIKAMQTVYKHFEWKVIAKKTLQLYEKLAER